MINTNPVYYHKNNDALEAWPRPEAIRSKPEPGRADKAVLHENCHAAHPHLSPLPPPTPQVRPPDFHIEKLDNKSPMVAQRASTVGTI